MNESQLEKLCFIPHLNHIFSNQVIIIWCITCIATISVVSGIGNGIRRISEVCFTVGMFVLLAIFFLGDPWFVHECRVNLCLS